MQISKHDPEPEVFLMPGNHINNTIRMSNEEKQDYV